MGRKSVARESVTTATPLMGSGLTAREDSLALGPEQSHRIIAILEEAVEKLGFLGSIMPDVLQHRDELSKFVGDEISRIIQVGDCNNGGRADKGNERLILSCTATNLDQWEPGTHWWRSYSHRTNSRFHTEHV